MDTQDSHWYEELFDAVYQFVGILDEQGKVVKVNQAALALTGLTQADLSGRPLWEAPWQALSKVNRREIKRAVNRAARGDFVRIELEIHLRSQPTETIDFTFKPIRDDKRAVDFVVAEGRNISVYKRTSEALFQSKARFATIFEKAGIGIVINGPDGKIIDCNPAFLGMLGYQLEEIKKLDYLEITHPSDRAANRKLFNELLDGKRESYSLEKRYTSKTGETIWVSNNASLVRGTNGKVQFAIVMAENITAQKQIEAEVIELRRRLMQGREMERLQLAQDLHDGPLQEVIGVSYQLKELESMLQDKASDEQLQAAQIALQQVARSIRSICSELRPSTLMPFGLEKAILSHSEEFQAAHPDLPIELHLVPDQQALPEQVRIALFRIYQESLNNILRHSQASKVSVRFWLSDEQVFLEIKDDGKGFKPPDHWIELARKGHLGLVGAIERAREVGGHLDVNSASGKGTQIRAVLPIRGEAIPGQYQEE
jgi:PAS domain S-box-containing protein